MNTKNPQWLCPICDNEIPFDDLMIDQFFSEILMDSTMNSVCEVQPQDDGCYLPSVEKEKPFEEYLGFVEDMASLVILSNDDSLICLDDPIIL